GEAALQQRYRDVVDRHSAACPTLGAAGVRMAVKHRGHRVAIDRLLQTARSEEGKDLCGFPDDSGGNRRVVQEHDALRDGQMRQRGFQLQCFVDRFVHEDLDGFFSPCTQRMRSEAARKALDAGKADAPDLTRLAIEYAHTDVFENLDNL